NGIHSQPFVSYLGSNPVQTAALAKNTDTVYRFTGGATLTWQAVQTARHGLRLVGAAGTDLFQQKAVVISPADLFFEQTLTNPGTSARGNADSRQWNWNANVIHAYTPASGSFKATTSGGVQVEDRELSRTRVVAHGLLPGQSNIDQASVLGQPFEFNPKERTLAFYAQEEFLTMGERLLLSAGFRAERSSANGDPNKYYLFPKAAASYRFPGLLGEGSELKLRGAYGETGNQPIFGQKFTTLAGGVTPVQTKNLTWLFRTTFTSLKNRVQDLPVPDVCPVVSLTDPTIVCGFRPPVAGFGLPYGEFFVQKGRPITQIIGTDTIP